MGKKEKAIKKLNNEFYKEYNQENAEKAFKLEVATGVAKQKIVDEREKAEERREELCSAILEELNEYTSHQGLDLSVSRDNMVRYIGFFLGEREVVQNKKVIVQTSTKKRDVFVKHVEKPKPKEVKEVKVEEVVPIVEDPEITMMKLDIQWRSGEDDIVQSYLNENYKGRMPEGWKWEELKDHLREKLMKIGSQQKYEDLVRHIGEQNYLAAKTKIGL